MGFRSAPRADINQGVRDTHTIASVPPTCCWAVLRVAATRRQPCRQNL